MNFIGKICPYCKSEFKEDDDVVICSVCEMPHHKECWIENKACTTFGCTGTIMGTENHSNVLICSDCGATYTEGEEFCASCGNVLLKSDQHNPQYDYSSGQPQYSSSSQPEYTNQTSNINYGQSNTNYNQYNEARIDEDIQTFIGVKQEYYFEKFQKFNIKNSKVSWNWASAFLGSYWYAYRKMYLIQFLYYVVYFFTVVFLGILSIGVFSINRTFTPALAIAPFLVFIAPFVISGIFGNYIYKCHVEKQVQIAKYMDVNMKQNYLMKKGGTSSGAVWALIGIRILIKIISAAA